MSQQQSLIHKAQKRCSVDPKSTAYFCVLLAYTVSGSGILEYVLLSFNFTKPDSTIDGSLEREREREREMNYVSYTGALFGNSQQWRVGL